MKTSLRWSWFLAFCGLVMYFLVSCYNDEGQKVLDPLREEKLLNTDGWKAFNEPWVRFRALLKVEGIWIIEKPEAKQGTILLKECLNKVKGLRKFKNKGLITDAELEAMTDYFSSYLELLHEPQRAALSSEAAKGMWARCEERAYYFLKRNQPLLNNLARQNNWIRWVKNHYIAEFIQFHFNEIENIIPDTIKYWHKSVDIQEVLNLKENVQEIIETIERSK